MNDSATVIFRQKRQGKNIDIDIEVPLDITANELIFALNYSYNLGINMGDVKECFLACERPIVLLRGDKKLRDFGVRNATVIYFKGLMGRKNADTV